MKFCYVKDLSKSIQPSRAWNVDSTEDLSIPTLYRAWENKVDGGEMWPPECPQSSFHEFNFQFFGLNPSRYIQ